MIVRWLALPVLVASLLFALAAAGAPASDLAIGGDLVQGGLVTGRAPPGSVVEVEGRTLRVAPDGRFLFGLGRDAGPAVELVLRYPDGRIRRQTLEIGERSFEVQRIDGLPPAKVTPRTPDQVAQIEREARAIQSARAGDSALAAAFETARWPLAGPVTGVFGSQRILNGQPRSPHKGVDVAAPHGTPVQPILPGAVTLAATGMYFTGGTVVIDHGHGLHSIYAHLDAVTVEVGEAVSEVTMIGRVGATGRATGPHLHVGIYWFHEALDPELLVGPMPKNETVERES